MPSRPCANPTCTAFAAPPRRFCEAHVAQEPEARREINRRYDENNRNRLAFYNSAAWARARARKLAAAGVCERCRHAWATEVHHLKPARDCRPHELIGQWNLRALCAPCHTALEAEEREALGAD